MNWTQKTTQQLGWLVRTWAGKFTILQGHRKSFLWKYSATYNNWQDRGIDLKILFYSGFISFKYSVLLHLYNIIDAGFFREFAILHAIFDHFYFCC